MGGPKGIDMSVVDIILGLAICGNILFGIINRNESATLGWIVAGVLLLRGAYG